MLIDYHIHTKRCRHASGELEEYLQEAYKKNIEEIGFSDHCPYLRTIKNSVDLSTVAMPLSELKDYVRDVKKLAKNSKIPIKLGLEVDFFKNDFRIFDYLNEYQFDYFIGSVHFIDDWGFDQEEFQELFKKTNPEEFYKKYFHHIQLMAQSNLFDIVGHFDLPKKFGYLYPSNLDKLLEKTLKIVKQHNMAVELNTSGKFKANKLGYYPEPKILKKCYELDIPLTLGSDSHVSENVGRDFVEAKKLLFSIGYKKIVRFTKHKMEIVNL